MNCKKLFLTMAGTLLATSTLALDNKVLLIGVDGVQLDKLQSANTPGFDRLNIHKAWTGGVDGEASEQATYSGPGWTTILTGVWVNKHGVTSNDSGLASDEFPSVYRRVKTAFPSAYIASYSTWAPIHTQFFTNDLGLMNDHHAGGSDHDNFVKALNTINQQNPDFVFLHLDEPDGIGHSSCFGSAYTTSIETADNRIGQLLDAVEAREANGEDWLVLITTDHGRDSLGCGHGGQTEQEKTIFIASNKTLNANATQPLSPPLNNDFNGLYGYAAQTALIPTVMRHMGATLTENDGFDAAPLVGTTGVRDLTYLDGTFQWQSTSTDTVSIYQNGTLETQLPANTQTWSVPDVITGQIDFSFILNGTPVSHRVNLLDITAAHGWNNLKSYMFRSDNQYVRYDEVLDKTDSGYPKEVNDASWPGLGAYRDQTVAAFKKDNSYLYYFLSTGEYIKYSIGSDAIVSGYPKPINDATWPGLGSYATQIVATLRWSGDKAYFFLDNGSYLRYDLDDDAVDGGYPKPVNDSTWPGLGAYAYDIQSALKWNNTRAYFFLKKQRYIRYSITLDRADSGYPKSTNNDTWPGLLMP